LIEETSDCAGPRFGYEIHGESRAVSHRTVVAVTVMWAVVSRLGSLALLRAFTRQTDPPRAERWLRILT
jgi:hypothetical protein